MILPLYIYYRKSLLLEIKATKDVLMSSLKNVHDLEVESRKVPHLEARIDDLEKLLPIERFQKYIIKSHQLYFHSSGRVKYLLLLTISLTTAS